MGRMKSKLLGGVVLAALCWPVMISTSLSGLAQSGWVDGRPMFRSDVIREQKRLERQRQTRRRKAYPALMQGGARPRIKPETPPIVALDTIEPAGTIIIDSGGRRLLYTLSNNEAYEYPISVGRQGFDWTGEETISRIAAWPSWHPPTEMRKRQPYLPKKMTGGVNNPLGAKALYLGNTLYRIHGTNDPKSIGRASSSGCFRMMNKHVLHLASLTKIGTKVRVVESYGDVQTAFQ
ncbi:MAG: L,D-transpeptidase [Hyphomicrobiales bacterium]|nr:L,D-transpeptidase [Hyphomicrobiales bacterium]